MATMFEKTQLYFVILVSQVMWSWMWPGQKHWLHITGGQLASALHMLEETMHYTFFRGWMYSACVFTLAAYLLGGWAENVCVCVVVGGVGGWCHYRSSLGSWWTGSGRDAACPLVSEDWVEGVGKTRPHEFSGCSTSKYNVTSRARVPPSVQRKSVRKEQEDCIKNICFIPLSLFTQSLHNQKPAIWTVTCEITGVRLTRIQTAASFAGYWY